MGIEEREKNMDRRRKIGRIKQRKRRGRGKGKEGRDQKPAE